MTTLIFDCDGVLAETERFGHLPAFTEVFAQEGLGVRWSEEEYGEKLRIGGGKERMAALLTPEFVAARGLPSHQDEQRALIQRWHSRKTAFFKQRVRAGLLPPRPGVKRIISDALAAGWTLVVASTSAEESVRAVLEHVVGRAAAARITVLAGDIVPAKKPDPAIYTLALEQTTSNPAATLVIEDSRNGLLAATGAGLPCLVTVSSYTVDEDVSEARLVVSDLGDPGSPMRVIENRGPARPAEYIVLEDLLACMEAPDREEAR